MKQPERERERALYQNMEEDKNKKRSRCGWSAFHYLRHVIGDYNSVVRYSHNWQNHQYHNRSQHLQARAQLEHIPSHVEARAVYYHSQQSSPIPPTPGPEPSLQRCPRQDCLNSLPLLLFFFSTKFLQKTLELLLLLLLLLFGHFVLSFQSKCSPSKMQSSHNTDAPLKLIKFSTTKFSLPFKCSSWRIDRASNSWENSMPNSQAPLVLFDQNHEAKKRGFFY
jgi:hypothetical protein